MFYVALPAARCYAAANCFVMAVTGQGGEGELDGC
ncbi:Uncharacterised protein [Mycobacteroides abscessus subsp. abscessus]|nr:Uncharacterised protein [Mycobacteroides abscessus subsp. abscessus]SIA06462.1 Uncharacterised protein [Mycobacteroides abscessus subsp. abscessus]SKR55488.1 Uncharacterised protein [Mycobacteroides abscessus subsp. abscessus]